MKNFVMVPEAELAALQKERDDLRAEVAKQKEQAQKERDAFLWAEQKRETARSKNHAALLADGDAAREALREACDLLDETNDDGIPRVSRHVTNALRERGGIA